MIGVEKMESLQVQLPNDLQEATKAMIGDALNKAIKDAQNKNSFPIVAYHGVSSMLGLKSMTSPQLRSRALVVSDVKP